MKIIVALILALFSTLQEPTPAQIHAQTPTAADVLQTDYMRDLEFIRPSSSVAAAAAIDSAPNLTIGKDPGQKPDGLMASSQKPEYEGYSLGIIS